MKIELLFLLHLKHMCIVCFIRTIQLTYQHNGVQILFYMIL